MKKATYLILPLISVIFLTACQSNAGKDSSKKDPESELQVQKQKITRNKKAWDEKVSDIKRIDVRTIGETSSYVFPQNLKEMKASKKPLIKGTVVNLEKMTNLNHLANTKATVKIDAVLMGDKKLKNKTITIVLSGGIVAAREYFNGMNLESGKYNGVTVNPDSNQKLYINDTDGPLPKIGSKIITDLSLNSYDKTDTGEFATMLRSNDLKNNKSYLSGEPFTFWVKNTNSKKYVLNNENYRRLTENDVRYDFAVNFTKEINQAYNK
ncbi:hypothetical protein [Companilactobacillus hulinensis]|uniref:hypothetical protein n=1 Tax=Companilactobacillus hulinensis TaxID=2486007 RepID=UPI000F78F995|nr:hypothetical protein [Companilactobacillus hulinensis]